MNRATRSIIAKKDAEKSKRDALLEAKEESYKLKLETEKEIKEKINKDNFMTWRFSPGYGDLPITLQREFVRVTDAEKRIGLTVNEGGILLPRKSVTAIIGLSKEPIPKQRRGCAYCNMNKTCQFRRGGTHCGF